MSTLLDTPPPQVVAALQSSVSVPGLLQRLYGCADVLCGYLFLALLADRPIDAFTLFACMLWPEAEWLRLHCGSASPVLRFQH